MRSVACEISRSQDRMLVDQSLIRSIAYKVRRS